AQAADAYAKCLRLDDRSSRVSYKLAVTHYTSRNYESAISLLTPVTTLNDEKRPDASYLLGMSLRARGRTDDAIRALQKSVAVAPDLVPAREELAELYAAAGRRSDELEQ